MGRWTKWQFIIMRSHRHGDYKTISLARGIVIIPVTFTSPLLSQTVTTGKSISFSTTVLGTAPISLQWYKDAKPIKDATNCHLCYCQHGVGRHRHLYALGNE